MTDPLDTIITWAKTTLGVHETARVRLLPAKSTNRTYRLDLENAAYILKVIAPERAASIAHERAICDYLAAHGFPVAPVRAVATNLPGVPGTVVLRRYVVGLPASEQVASFPPTRRADFLAQMSALLARVHTLPLAAVLPLWQFPRDTVTTPAEWADNFVAKKIASDLGVLLPSGALPPEIAAAMADELPRWGASLAATPVPLAPLHGDYYLDNLIVDDAGAIATALDWEAARLGDPLWDLARTEAASFADTPDAFTQFLAAYTASVPWAVDTGRIRRYRLLMAMGDLRYAVRHAPALTAARVPPVVALWRKVREI